MVASNIISSSLLFNGLDSFLISCCLKFRVSARISQRFHAAASFLEKFKMTLKDSMEENSHNEVFCELHFLYINMHIVIVMYVCKWLYSPCSIACQEHRHKKNNKGRLRYEIWFCTQRNMTRKIQVEINDVLSCINDIRCARVTVKRREKTHERDKVRG